MNIQQKLSTEKNYILVNKIKNFENGFSVEQHALTDERIFSSAEFWNIRRRSKTSVTRRRFF